jgi:transposase
MHVCILDQAGNTVFDKGIPCRPEALLRAIQPYRENLVIGAECMFAWYWVADLCVEQNIGFVLGHALYMKAIHGGKAKNDRIDAGKIARLLRGGTFPLAYAYPKGMRETRDLMRRRTYLVRKRAELLTHLQILNAQYNLAPFPKKLAFAANRIEMKVAERFDTAGQFLSYARLVRCAHESGGKKLGTGGKKIGNAHLRWAFAEAACLFLRTSERAKKWKHKQAAQRGEGKALAILAAKLGRAIYHMLRKGEAFDEERFWQGGTEQAPTSSSPLFRKEASHARN